MNDNNSNIYHYILDSVVGTFSKVSISTNGNIIAGLDNSLNIVRIFKYENGSLNEMLSSSPIYGLANSTAESQNIQLSGNGSKILSLNKIYEWNGSNWIQIGSNFLHNLSSINFSGNKVSDVKGNIYDLNQNQWVKSDSLQRFFGFLVILDDFGFFLLA